MNASWGWDSHLSPDFRFYSSGQEVEALFSLLLVSTLFFLGTFQLSFCFLGEFPRLFLASCFGIKIYF